jgi:hypothetical protein
MEVLGIFIVFVVLAVVFRLCAGTLDADRVENYVKENGWELVDRSWDPFGPGWFGEKDARIYQIIYRDRQGHLHRAHVKTSMFSGVYFTNDEIIEAAPSPAPAPESPSAEERRLAEENRQLKNRIQELEERDPK